MPTLSPRLQERLDAAHRALGSLEWLVERRPWSMVERDAAIQRFQYSHEATWKAAQAWLAQTEGLDAGSPKAVVRGALQAGLIGVADCEHLLALTDDRNRSVHTYNEGLASEIAARLPAHAAALRRWLDSVRHRAAAQP